MCVSVCNVSSVYERDSVCVYRSVMSRVFMRESSVCVYRSVMSRVFMREIVCVCIGL